jgi:formylglycine-generating enzyme required for sulfatase activity
MLTSAAGVYSIDRTEVTRSAYAQFLIEKGVDTSGQVAQCAWNTSYDPVSTAGAEWPPLDRGDHPVSHVDWCDAHAYCQWAGKRLCGMIGGGPADGDFNIDRLAEQWPNACSADGTNRFFPTYDYFPGHCQDVGVGATSTAPVASLPECQSPTPGFGGVFDINGNVAEWIDRCRGTAGSGDPCNAAGGDYQSSSPELNCQTPYSVLRGDAASPNLHVGIRCCSDP